MFKTLSTYADTENVAKLLIANGANVNAVNKHGHSPLHQAALFGKFLIWIPRLYKLICPSCAQKLRKFQKNGQIRGFLLLPDRNSNKNKTSNFPIFFSKSFEFKMYEMFFLSSF